MPCYYPIHVKNPQGGSLLGNCGQCPYCLQRRANNYIFRCLQQLKVTPLAHFVTLTYEDPPLSPNGFMTLQKSDFQKFMKRLRKRCRPQNNIIKYFACGEYGTQTERPHYHAIIYNAKYEDIEAAWNDYPGNGLLHRDDVNGNTVAYVAKYMLKGKFKRKHKNDDREKEFQLFSKALGVNYINAASIKWHKEDISRQYATINGYKIALPRWFREQLYDEAERNAIQDLSIEEANKRLIKQLNEYEKHGNQAKSFHHFQRERKRNAIENFQKKLAERKKI